MGRKKIFHINKKLVNPRSILTFLSYLFIILPWGAHQAETFGTFDIVSKIIIYALMTIAFINFGFVINTSKDKIVSALFIGLAINPWLRLILVPYHRVTVIADLVLITLTVIYMVYICKKGYLNTIEYIIKKSDKTYLHAVFGMGAALFEILMHIMHDDYSPAGETFSFALLFGVSVFATIFFVIISISKKQKGFIHYGLFSLCVFVITFLFSALILNSINYAFDFLSPERETVVITDIDAEYDRDYGRHSALSGHMDYEFTVDLNGEEIELDVTSMHYEAYNIGDTIVLLRYKGALGVPYYTIEPIE